MYVCTVPYLPRLYPCTLPTAPVSRSFGLRSSYEIDILDTDQRPRNKSLRLLNQFKLRYVMEKKFFYTFKIFSHAMHSMVILKLLLDSF